MLPPNKTHTETFALGGEKKEDARPYSLRPRGAPVSVFLQEAARRAAEAKEAAKVDPWESDGGEEEEKDAAAEEEEDPLRGQRMHAWVREGGREGGTAVAAPLVVGQFQRLAFS